MTKAIFQIGRLKRLGALAPLTLALCAPLPAQEGHEKDLLVSCFVERDNSADPGSVRAALEGWVTSVSPEPASKIGTKTESNPLRFLESIEQGAQDLYGLFTYQYLELEDPSILRPCLSIVGGHGTTSTFLLLARKDAHIENINQLRDKRILVDTSGHGQLPLIWLATEIGKTTSAAEIRDFATIVPVQRPHRALFPVYFEKADACIISRNAFTEASKLNPNLTNDLGELDNSAPLLVSMFAFHRDYPLVPAEKFIGNALKAKESRSSRSLFGLIERTGVDAFNESALLSVTALYNEYKALLDPPSDEKGARK